MAVVRLTNGILQGLAADTKPATYPTGTIFIETDTRLTYIWTGTYWETQRFLQHPRSMKQGYWYGLSGTAGTGSYGHMDAGTTITSGTGALTGLQRLTAGSACRFTTGATAASLSGYRGPLNGVAGIWRRSYNPLLEIKMTLNQTTNQRMAFGFVGSTAASAAGAEPLATLSGILFWLDTGVDANWHIAQNNGAATSDLTTINNVVAADTNPHIFGLRAVTDTKFQYQYDGGAWTDITTKIPASSTGLTWYWWMENIGANTDTYDVYWAYSEVIG
jgi:hypothetical protein